MNWQHIPSFVRDMAPHMGLTVVREGGVHPGCPRIYETIDTSIWNHKHFVFETCAGFYTLTMHALLNALVSPGESVGMLMTRRNRRNGIPRDLLKAGYEIGRYRHARLGFTRVYSILHDDNPTLFVSASNATWLVTMDSLVEDLSAFIKRHKA